MIPITFLTGFYVSEVVRRYWEQYRSLPYPDRLALKLVAYIPGKACKIENLYIGERDSLICLYYVPG